MQRTFFNVALATLATCGLAGIAISTARAQSGGPFGTLVPIPQGGGSSLGGLGGGGRFSPAANAMFGSPGSQFGSSFGNAPFGTWQGDLQAGIYDVYGNPVAYGLYNGNGPAIGWSPGGWGPGYANYGGGYLNNEMGYRGYSPYYGNNAGNGMNDGGVNSGAYGNDTAPVYYGNGSYTNGLDSNIYYTPTYAPASGAYRGNAAPVRRGALGWF
jgi:hypothetical protein